MQGTQEQAQGDPYDEKDAFITYFAEYNGYGEAEVKAVMHEVIAESPRVRRAVKRVLRAFREGLEDVPNALRREAVLQAARKAREEKAHLGWWRDYPALRKSLMLRIASVFYHQRKVEAVFVPLVSDCLLELKQARPEGRLKVVVVHLQHWVAFARAMRVDAMYPWMQGVWRVWQLVLWLLGKP
jgi:hypothetical protein